MERLQSTAVEDADSRGHAQIKTLNSGGDDDDCENTNDEGQVPKQDSGRGALDNQHKQPL